VRTPPGDILTTSTVEAMSRESAITGF
jgi:hypothetical protein